MNWLGILHLDTEDAVLESSAELEARHAVMPFSVGDPSFWRVPFLNAIATGAEPHGNKLPTDAASRGIVDAVRRLDGKVQLIIGNCGFMWASRNLPYRTASAATITSGLEFLDLALRITGRSVGVITWGVRALDRLLSGPPNSNVYAFWLLPSYQSGRSHGPIGNLPIGRRSAWPTNSQSDCRKRSARAECLVT
ncbi:hypothetical protein B0G81_8711 [Paraburkholderia sp. BL6665CI2N2]|nr:hypothetical protein B0G81_8711 [Paraburkholderia sp. BL6665CI2N2]